MVPQKKKMLPGYTVLDCLGQGTFSIVYRATQDLTGVDIALKQISKNGDLSYDELIHEIGILEKLDHPYVCKYFGFKQNTTHYFILQEYINGTSLLNLVNKRRRLPEAQAQRIFIQLIAALKYLHIDMNIVHRDIKLENILIDSLNTVKLIDFGLSKNASNITSTQCGSFPYAAPEIFYGFEYSSPIDIWSTGVCLFGMLCGFLPFEADSYPELGKKVCNDEPNYPSTLSPNALDLLKRILDKDPNTRIKITEIYQHPFVTSCPDYFIMCDEFIMNESLAMLPRNECDFDEDILEFFQSKGISRSQFLSGYMIKKDEDIIAAYKILKSRNIKKIFSDPKGLLPISHRKSLPPNSINSLAQAKKRCAVSQYLNPQLVLEPHSRSPTRPLLVKPCTKYNNIAQSKILSPIPLRIRHRASSIEIRLRDSIESDSPLTLEGGNRRLSENICFMGSNF